MNLGDFFSMYVGFLGDALKFDFHVMSQWWMYAPLLIPILLYAVFFMIKWFLITMPVWLPAYILLATIKGIVNPSPPETATSEPPAPRVAPTLATKAGSSVPFPNVGFPKPSQNTDPLYGRAVAGENLDAPNPDDPLDALAQLARDAEADQARGAAFANKLMGKSPKRSKK